MPLLAARREHLETVDDTKGTRPAARSTPSAARPVDGSRSWLRIDHDRPASSTLADRKPAW